MRRSVARGVVLSAVIVLVTAGIASPTVPLDPVVTANGEQYHAFANDGYVAFTNWVRKTKVSTAFARPLAGGARFRLNKGGTGGNVGGFDPGTNTVILQQWNRRDSGIYSYDLDTDIRKKIPGVNSARWEWDPMISSTFILYAQDRFRHGDLFTSLKMFRRTNAITRTLGTWRWKSKQVFVGSVGDRYGTFTVCGRRTCSAYLYDWVAKAIRRIPTANRKAQYAPVVDEGNGTVYFSRSNPRKCGRGVNIWRRPLPIAAGDPVTKIVHLPSGVDTGWSSSLTANTTSGQMDLYIERWVCATRNGDVYAAHGVDAIPPP